MLMKLAHGTKSWKDLIPKDIVELLQLLLTAVLCSSRTRRRINKPLFGEVTTVGFLLHTTECKI